MYLGLEMQLELYFLGCSPVLIECLVDGQVIREQRELVIKHTQGNTIRKAENALYEELSVTTDFLVS